MNLTCKRCGYGWWSKKDNPKQCPGCKSMKWDSYRTGDEPGAENKVSYKVDSTKLELPVGYDSIEGFRADIEAGKVDSYRIITTFRRIR